METADVVECFYGVYMLYCKNPKYKGRIYIGYTVDPNRRIKQHNAGKEFGGAWRTSNKGPWSMVLIVHGFPNDISALRFEWAWQHPDVSRRLRHVPRKKHGEKSFDFHLMVLAEMLRVGPWSRLPLTIRWLDPDLAKDFPTDRAPPLHMPLVYGKVITKKVLPAAGHKNAKRKCNQDFESGLRPSEGADPTGSGLQILPCYLCNKFLDPDQKISCISPTCSMASHLICLANKFRKDPRMILPIEGTCPACKINILWGDLIKKMKGCYQNLRDDQSDSELSDFL